MLGCEDAREPGIPGGGGGNVTGNPVPRQSDSGILSDGTAPAPDACLDLPVFGLTNDITVTSSLVPLDFTLSHVYAEWDCAAEEPSIELSMNDASCSLDTGQRLTFHIPVNPESLDTDAIVASAMYVRPAGYSLQGQCVFTTGTFTFDTGVLEPYRFKATFTLNTFGLSCTSDLESAVLEATGAFDITLEEGYLSACATD